MFITILVLEIASIRKLIDKLASHPVLPMAYTYSITQQQACCCVSIIRVSSSDYIPEIPTIPGL